jgi:GntR family transcriptional regulator
MGTDQMVIRIDPHSGIPAYRQIVDQIRREIASGRLTADAELPSTRALSERLGINPMTVSKAYSQLVDEGVVLHRPGLPLQVRERSADAMERDREQQLRAMLEPAARAARQLGVSAARATAVFRETLAEVSGEEKRR